MNHLTTEIENELVNHILPYWMSLKDEENGGFYGFVDFDLNVDKKGAKGGIAVSRILWTFSNVYNFAQKNIYLDYAAHAYQFLVSHLIDKTHGGIYWLVDYKGDVIETSKHIYAQAFAVYGLSEYYRASKDEAALEYAKEIYNLIIGKGYNKLNEAYLEEFSQDWKLLSTTKLGENGILPAITMNTHLHVLEAFTNLFRVWKDEELKNRILHLVDIFKNKIYNLNFASLNVFMDADWCNLIDLRSYGHDIEASWLIDEALEVIEAADEQVFKMNLDIAESVLANAVDKDGALMNEREDGKIDTTRIWWVEAEAFVGFINAYQKSKDERFLQAARNVWEYIKCYVSDKREGGEWFSSVNQNGEPIKKPITEPWKLLYHNSRFCVEAIKRLNTLS